MANIKIKQSSVDENYSLETSVEVEGAEYGVDELTKTILNAMGHSCSGEVGECGCVCDEGNAVSSRSNTGESGLCRLRRTHSGYIYPALLAQYKVDRRLPEIISPFDEIDIPLDTGDSVTVVCGYVEPGFARFVFKDCWKNDGVMNEDATNKGGYFKSKGRQFVLNKIWPHISPEWQAIIQPRHLKETIDGGSVEYDDPMWLPSATDMFGPPNDRWWNEEHDSFQLPIFQKERDRIKEYGDQGTCSWWLRSASVLYSYSFCYVYNDGGADDYSADCFGGFAPGFDI